MEIMDTVKAEKASAMRRYRRIRTVGRLFRCLEACAAIMIISWSSAKLPAAARLSSDLFRSAAAVLLSPRFVFLFGNAIVLVLFAKSGNLSPSPTSTNSSSPVSASPTPSDDLYDEFLEIRGRVSHSLAPPPSEGDVVYEDKAVCVETKRECRRTRSEKMEKPQIAPELRPSETDLALKVTEVVDPELRRSETDLALKVTEIVENVTAAEDDDEFRRTIEAFIEKQLKFHRQESMTMVSSAASTPLNPDQIKYE